MVRGKRSFGVYRLAINPTKPSKSNKYSLQKSSSHKRVKDKSRPISSHKTKSNRGDDILDYDKLNEHIDRIQNRITKRVF